MVPLCAAVAEGNPFQGRGRQRFPKGTPNLLVRIVNAMLLILGGCPWSLKCPDPLNEYSYLSLGMTMMCVGVNATYVPKHVLCGLRCCVHFGDVDMSLFEGFLELKAAPSPSARQ